ncbi:MAG: C39 family peptidase [Patescibacteria group bacterium]
MKKYLVLLLAFILLVGFGVWQYAKRNNPDLVINLPPAQNFQEFVEQTSTPIISDEAVESTTTSAEPEATLPATVDLPNKINLNIPFTSQAPTANWNQPFQDACEEASVLMAVYYYENRKFPSSADVEKIILDLVQWQIDHWGVHKNMPVAEVADFAQNYYGYQTEIVNDLTIDKIKQYLQAGRPVIVPANGKKLANPNFRNGGPLYHMLVIKGFADDKFITNDPGTRKGADFIYTQANLMGAIADWGEDQNAAMGPRRALILLPK